MRYFLDANEKWVKSWNHCYSATTEGEIFTYQGGVRAARIIKYVNNSKPTFSATVPFSYNRKVKTVNVAVVIFETFVRKLEDGEVLVPVNGDKNDLRLENIKVVMADSFINSKKSGLPKSSGKIGRPAKEYLLEAISTGELICFRGLEGAKEYGLNGAALGRLISQSSASGSEYITLNKTLYRYLVA